MSGEAPDLREVDCPTGEACDYACDIHAPTHPADADVVETAADERKP